MDGFVSVLNCPLSGETGALVQQIATENATAFECVLNRGLGMFFFLFPIAEKLSNSACGAFNFLSISFFGPFCYTGKACYRITHFKCLNTKMLLAPLPWHNNIYTSRMMIVCDFPADLQQIDYCNPSGGFFLPVYVVEVHF